jgi:phosphoribosylformimino-5-aminoimidazole carboxamide ribotide isomerase
MITGGSIAVIDREKFLSWLNSYGCEKIILGADHRKGWISTLGWTETSDMELMDFIRSFLNDGITKVICTDISLDGTLKGSSVNIYRKILAEFPELQLIASGGVGVKEHITDLRNAGIKSVIVGKAIYEGRITKKDIRKFIEKRLC